MIRHANEQTVEFKCIRGGNGETEMHKLLNGEAEMSGKGRMFNLMTLAPGRSIGEHRHSGDSETFYFLSGHGVYTDNGDPVEVSPGDVALCRDGESHALVNNTKEPLTFIALILYT